MKTLNISLSEKDFKKYGIESEEISFDSLIEKVKNVIAEDALKKCHALARKAGLEAMDIDQINTEIEAVRHAKNNS